MEQSANPIARLRTNTHTIQAVTKDTSFQAYIWLLTAAAPSDSVFRVLAQIDLLTYLHFARGVAEAKCSGQGRLSVCLSLTAFPHYCTDLDVTWGNGSRCPLVVHYWTDLRSVHGFHCYDNIAPNAKCQRVQCLVFSQCWCFLLQPPASWKSAGRSNVAVRALYDGPHTHVDFGPPMCELWRRGLHYAVPLLQAIKCCAIVYNISVRMYTVCGMETVQVTPLRRTLASSP